MAGLPELSESTKRKLVLQWSGLLDTYRFTGMRTRKVAAARFNALAAEYWRFWLSSGGGYETYVDWLRELKRQVSVEVASIWTGQAKVLDNLYEKQHAPAVEKTIESMVKNRTRLARDAELKRREAAENPEGASEDARPDSQLTAGALALARFKAGTQATALPPSPPPDKGTLATTQSQSPDPDKPVDLGPWRKGKSCRAAVDAFISRMAEARYKIRRKDIPTAGGYSDPTQFQRYQRGDPRTTKIAIVRFNAVLSMKPEEFMRVWKKNKSALEKKKARFLVKSAGE